MQKFERQYVTLSLASNMALLVFPLIVISSFPDGSMTEMNRKNIMYTK